MWYVPQREREKKDKTEMDESDKASIPENYEAK